VLFLIAEPLRNLGRFTFADVVALRLRQVPVRIAAACGTLATVTFYLIAQMVVPLPLGGSDPGRRLRQIAAETAERKARTRTSLGTLFGGRIARRLLLKAAMRQRVNVTSASIPGPAVPLYLAGARVLEVFPVLPLIANEPLGVGAVSYAGTFTIGVVADRDAYPDLDAFAAGVRDELHALGVSTDPISSRPREMMTHDNARC